MDILQEVWMRCPTTSDGWREEERYWERMEFAARSRKMLAQHEGKKCQDAEMKREILAEIEAERHYGPID